MGAEKKYNILRFVFLTLSGFFFSLLLGYLFKGFDIFNFKDPGSQFLIYGFIGSVIFCTLKLTGLRNFIFVSILIFALSIVLYKITYIPLIPARLLYFASIAVSVYLYFILFENRMTGVKFGKFFALAGLIATGQLVSCLIVMPFMELAEPKLFLAAQVFYGLLIGSGIGAGFEIWDIIEEKILKHK